MSIKKLTSMPALLILSLLVAGTVSAGDTWPFTGNSAPGVNQPNIHGYTSGQILNWSPSTDPDAASLRSKVPLQSRNAAFTATQANPSINPNIQMNTVAGDYGNAFIENAAYTNKFAQYHFNFWQYLDYYTFWHGTATAYTPPSYYDATAQQDYTQKWFEFGILNIPNPAYTDAAHKNGVKSLAGIFFSDNDRGQQTYKQMIVKDASGNYPVAQKLVEMAQYFGYDGYFFNQEELSPNVATTDIPAYKGFLKTLKSAGLYVFWDDSLNTTTGANAFARTFNSTNASMLHDSSLGQLSDSFFFDYGMTNSLITSAISYLNTMNSTYGTSYNIFKQGFAGIEAGRDRFTSVNGTQLSNKSTSNLLNISLVTLGADFVHAGLDEDMGLSYPSNHRVDNAYQWMTNVRDQLWWSGPNINPKNTTVSTTNTASDVYADNRYWKGIASVIAERSVIGGTNFYTNFNTGHGLNYYVNGTVSNSDEWSNMSLQDISPTWQWWQDTTGNRLVVDFDYGSEYNIASTSRYSYQQIGGYNGGSSLVVNGNLNAENFLRLYKSNLNVNANSKLSISYQKPSATDASTMSIGLVFADNPSTVVKVAVPNSGVKSTNWITQELDLSAYAGKTIAAFGLVFNNGSGTISNYQMNIGQLRVYDGSAVAPTAPTGLAITEAFTNSDELNVKWNMSTNYSQVKQYNVYVNDVFIGGKYDDNFYIKKLLARAGTIKVVPVGANGLEGSPATLAFDLSTGVSGINVTSDASGQVNVSWTNPTGSTDTTTVAIKSLNWITTPSPVSTQTIVAAGATSASFTGMPTNGDDYLVTITKGSGLPVSISGNFIDTTVAPYAEAWSWSGNTLSLPMPNTRDWRYMYVYEGGTAKSFATTYSSGNKPRIIRGRSTKASLSFTSTATKVYVVMEDYAGNLSTPVYVRGSAGGGTGSSVAYTITSAN
ncbi:endo-beta-N-acetylglucosaminidase [Gorillibacterium massiliense]|uniref:endo-beta-N-acetylglucosaminidase n=1 Tax=Gorillibacterium massiliense TaxID=1280390 RepID=UPI0004ACD8E1|nr:hypothetical protein [Gorillibacterium massiliense]